MKKIWLVKFPTSQYNEDVKALARKNDLIIYDAKFKNDLDPKAVESNPPKLTIVGAKDEVQKSKKVKKEVEPLIEVDNAE